MPYTESELETIGKITEEAKHKAWSLGFEGANDLEDAFKVILWRLEYLETCKEIHEAVQTLNSIRQQQPENRSERDEINRDVDRTLTMLDYLDKRLIKIFEAQPVHMKSVI